ncbi:MAG: hypothetical protein ACRDJM_03250, partial [Actinomycetota bacterium]
MLNRRLLASLVALAVVASMAAAGAGPAGPIGRSSVRSVTADATPTTLYLHGHLPAGAADEALEFLAAGEGPFMNTTPPTEVAPKVATWTAAGNQNFRKNFLNAYWGGKIAGTITNNPTVSFWIVAPVSTEVEVSLFGDGGIGVASPMARKRQSVLAPVPTLVEVEFTGLTAVIEEEIVLQIGTYITAAGSTPSKILYDSTELSSGMSFGLAPLGSLLPALDDAAGIAYLDGDLLATNAGTGHLVRIGAGIPAAVIAGGLVPGGFARGATGIAVDADGRIYYAVADTGEIRVAGAGGPIGVLARGLGVPMGLAFGPDGLLYVSDAAAKRVLRVTASGSWTSVATLPETPWGIAFAPGGQLAVATNSGSGTGAVGRVRMVDVSNGAVTLRTALSAGSSVEGLAYGATGNLYAGSGRNGTLYRIPPAGDVQSVATGLGGPLALAFAPGGDLTIATQGEGRTAGDAILTSNVGEAGVA